MWEDEHCYWPSLEVGGCTACDQNSDWLPEVAQVTVCIARTSEHVCL